MKKLFIVFALLFSNFAFADAYVATVSNCDDAQMRAALDNAAAEHRAVITVIECDRSVDNSAMISSQARTWNRANAYRPCHNHMKPVTAVVRREYFVRETVQEYKPVIKYVPTNTYVRVRPACNECD